MPSRFKTLLFVYILVIYSFIQAILYVYPFWLAIEPDSITVFKMLCIMMLMGSTSLVVVSINKENMTILLSSEITIISAAIGLLLLTILYTIEFYKSWNWGSDSFRKTFFVFLVQRVGFFVIFVPSIFIVEMYRRQRSDLLDLTKWELEEVFDVPLDENRQLPEPYTLFPHPNSQPSIRSPLMNAGRPTKGSAPGGFNIGKAGGNTGAKGGTAGGKNAPKSAGGPQKPKQEYTPTGKSHPVGGNFSYGRWIEQKNDSGVSYGYEPPVPRPILQRPYGGIMGLTPGYLPSTFVPPNLPKKPGNRQPYKDPQIPTVPILPPGYPVPFSENRQK